MLSWQHAPTEKLYRNKPSQGKSLSSGVRRAGFARRKRNGEQHGRNHADRQILDQESADGRRDDRSEPPRGTQQSGNRCELWTPKEISRNRVRNNHARGRGDTLQKTECNQRSNLGRCRTPSLATIMGASPLGVRPYYCVIEPCVPSQEEGRDHLLSRGGFPLSKPIETSRQGFLHASRTDLLASLPLTIYGVSSLLTCSFPCREHSARVPGGVLGGLAEHTAHANADSCH